MNAGTLRNSAKESINLIKRLGLLGNFNTSPIYTHAMPSELRPLDYESAWQKCIEKNWYDIKLEDNSLMIFRQDGFSFIMVPFKTMPFEDYVTQYYPEPEWFEDENSIHDIVQLYDSYTESQKTSQPVMPVRFDMDLKGYCEHIHPLFHMHFGINNESRIPVAKELTPLSFTAFIIRTFYPKVWKEFSESGDINHYIEKFKANLPNVPAANWGEFEKQLLFIG
ncbi:DUF2290 domain-containing protein [Serratia fonticola]|uniref:DUF2290 domain-containing protein n=1 Tax=Serratia fonticola TaxID=47917 RepID=UPI003BB6FE5E